MNNSHVSNLAMMHVPDILLSDKHFGPQQHFVGMLLYNNNNNFFFVTAVAIEREKKLIF